MEDLVLDVINQIEKDIENKDLAPIYELLSLLPKEALESYKSEAEEYDYLELDKRCTPNLECRVVTQRQQ